MHHVKFPAFLTIRNAKCIIERCEQAIISDEKEILFDFSICSFCDPFAITLLVGAMKACIAKAHTVKYRRSPNKRLEDYLKSISFYDWGSSIVGKSKFSSQQVELRHLTAVEPVYTDAVIQVLQSSLRMSQGVKGALHLSINELMTNTFDHSQTVALFAYIDETNKCIMM